MIDQAVLARVIAGSARDLSSATSSLDSINNRIILLTEEDTLYRAIMAEARTRLETKFTTKITEIYSTLTPAWQLGHAYSLYGVVRPIVPNGYVYYALGGGTSGAVEPTWPTIPGNTVVDNGITWECENLEEEEGETYGTSGISDWEIKMQPADVSIYQYQHTITDVKTYALGDFGGEGNRTFRNIVGGFSQSIDWMRIGIKAHSGQVTTINNLSIGEQDGSSQNIVSGTMKFFVFSGNRRVDISPGTIGYTDWLEYSLDMSKNYFVTMFVESSFITYVSTGNFYYRLDDYSLIENWGTAGSGPIGQTRMIKVIQGWENGPGQGWDDDPLIQQDITDYESAYNMVYNNPFGSYYMLSALSQGQSLISAKKTMITNRNQILAHYVV